MFKFLKLRNSVSGDARRHVPFTSIIHKPLFVLIALVFSFVAIVPIKVYAAAPQIRPQFKPILDTDIVNFQDSYFNLDPAAQAAASLLFGAYVTEYAGLADYGYVFQSIPTEASFKERLIFLGDQVVDTLFLPVNMADQLVLTPLINLGQGIINKVKGVTDVDDFYDDIIESSDYGLSFTPDIGFSLNQLMANSGGLYNWQFSNDIPTSFSWNNITLDPGIQDYYHAVVSSYTYPNLFNSPTRVVNNSYWGGVKNGIMDIDIVGMFTRYHNIFVDVQNNLYGYYDDNGNFLNNNLHFPYNFVTAYTDGSTYSTGSYDRGYAGYSYSSSLSKEDVIKNIYNGTLPTFEFHCLSNGPIYFSVPNLLANHVDFDFYYGINWENRIQFEVNSDQVFGNTDSLEYLNPIKDAIFDLKELINQVIDAQPDPAYELPLKPIIYNITQVDGSPLTAEDLQGISFNVTPPESGIDVPANVFLPFFDDGKGFISYMWYMTKPLVSYTRSFLDAIIFDPVEGFNASGPGYFILGVAAIGLIGGVVVKFLL